LLQQHHVLSCLRLVVVIIVINRENS